MKWGRIRGHAEYNIVYGLEIHAWLEWKLISKLQLPKMSRTNSEQCMCGRLQKNIALIKVAFV